MIVSLLVCGYELRNSMFGLNCFSLRRVLVICLLSMCLLRLMMKWYWLSLLLIGCDLSRFRLMLWVVNCFSILIRVFG